LTRASNASESAAERCSPIADHDFASDRALRSNPFSRAGNSAQASALAAPLRRLPSRRRI